ncbi:DEAD/DEAH box helicase [Streptomyces sp. NRRL F-5135]|uniref:DEAD/DEAH box helicase n=1 Tax=Streptomyces sp. NRRL F-5135 TaxID=1463858 RepID=UPI00099D7080|nr:DEAD/DEAH box helicase [Streptomyces sp. NRRL F-5135]
MRYPRRPRPLVKLEECDLAVPHHHRHRPSHSSHGSFAGPPTGVTDLARCSTAFLPSDPARTGRVAFWRPDGTGAPDLPAATDRSAVGELTVAAGPDGDTRTIEALLVPTATALPLLTRARLAPDASPSTAFWGAAALLALRIAADGKLLPDLSGTDHDAWRAGPLTAEDQERVRLLAAAMPAVAHSVPLGTAPPRSLLLPAPERLLRSFVDAVVDGLPRTPAAPLVAAGPAFAAAPVRRPAPSHLAVVRDWVADVSATTESGVRLSLRIEVSGLTAAECAPEDRPRRPRAKDAPATARPPGPAFRAVLQMHSVLDPSVVADAADVWSGAATGTVFGPRARRDALLALRRAARVWPALGPLLSAAVPDAVDLADDEITELLGRASEALGALGVQVHWPRELVRTFTARAVIGPSPSAPGTHVTGDTPLTQQAPGAPDTPYQEPTDPQGPAGQAASGTHLPPFLSADSLLTFHWQFALGDHRLGRAELDRLAEAGRPLVRLRDQWVLVDPARARRARDQEDRRTDRSLTPIDALSAVLTGSTEIDGERVEVRASGPLARLRDRITAPEGADGPDDSFAGIGQPAGLAATLRDYQLRGLNWLHRMTSLGLGGCLADDMGLGKTITLIALHLHRQGEDPAGEHLPTALPDSGHGPTAGPTLVVCPASLLGNWQREIERFAPGTPVRRYHGAGRDLATPAAGEFVLTTYGTMRLDAATLARTDWGLVVADEAQHIKNPYSATARQLRLIGGRAKVALSGTPVENNLSELWAILDWTTPGLLGRLGTFRGRYARAIEGGGDPAAAERLAALVRPFLLRRRKSDPGIAPELPPKTETDRAVSLTAEQAGLYEAVVRETLAAIGASGGMERRGLIVTLLTALKQICNHPAQYLKEEQPRLVGRSGKLELLDELLGTILAEGASVLVFTQYVQMARLLALHLEQRGVPALCLHGGTPVAEREAMVDRFQSGEVPVFLLSLKAAGTGLNLTRAEHVVHFDRWWNPAVEAQATDRAYRIGQDRPVQVHRMITEGTIEDRVAAMLARKRELADAVLGSGEAALTELTDAELADLVELRGSIR